MLVHKPSIFQFRALGLFYHQCGGTPRLLSNCINLVLVHNSSIFQFHALGLFCHQCGGTPRLLSNCINLVLVHNSSVFQFHALGLFYHQCGGTPRLLSNCQRAKTVWRLPKSIGRQSGASMCISGSRADCDGSFWASRGFQDGGSTKDAKGTKKGRGERGERREAFCVGGEMGKGEGGLAGRKEAVVVTKK